MQLQADLSITDQVVKVVRSCYYNIRQLRTIRSALTPDAPRDAAYTLILSRLDYCDALYINCPTCELHRLQMLINTAARVVSGRSKFDPITDFVRNELHWLPVAQRVQFKVSTLVYKAIHGLASKYLSDMIVKSTVVPRCRNLRSSAHLQTDSCFTSAAFHRTCLRGCGSDVVELTSRHMSWCYIANNFSYLLKEYMFNIAYGNN